MSDYELSGWELKADLAKSQGIGVDSFILYKNQLEAYGGKSIKQEEAEAVIDKTRVNENQKAYIWALQNKTWSPNNNPYQPGLIIKGYTKEK